MAKTQRISKKQTPKKPVSKKQSAKQKKAQSNTRLWMIGGVALVVVVVVGILISHQPAVSSAAEKALPLEVSVSEAADLRDAGAFMLDVREPEEWMAGHIPGATLIPLGELASRVSEVPTDRQVVVVCRSGNRSATGRDILRDAGLEQVTSMAGGMNQWAGAGYETVTGP